MAGTPHRPLRFCMVTTFYPPYSFGGDAVFVERLSHELAKRGHQVDVVHCVDAYRMLGGKEPGGAGRDHPGIRVHSLRSPAGWLWPLAMQQTGGPAFHAGQLRELLESGFDVIHYHNVSLMGGPDVLAYGRAIKLYTMHEYWLVCPTHLLYRLDREPCERPHCFACTLAHKRPPQLWRYTGKLDAAARHVDAFLAASNFCLEAHRRRGLRANIKLLPHFVPPAEPNVPAFVHPGPPYFLFVGRLETIKGLHTLLPHFQRETGAELWVAGAGSQETGLRRLAAGNPRIRFLGHVTEPRLSELYRNAMALVVPSLCHEMFPLVILEAFRQRTPVIARQLGGMRETVESSQGGITYVGANELSSAMKLLLEQPAVRDRMGQRGLSAFLQQWTPEAHLDRYFSLIDEIARTRP